MPADEVGIENADFIETKLLATCFKKIRIKNKKTMVNLDIYRKTLRNL